MMNLQQALEWADKNCEPKAVERLRSRQAVKALADAVRMYQAQIEASEMSDQSEAQDRQNYRETARMCGNCRRCETIVKYMAYDPLSPAVACTKEAGKRCGLGGFTVKADAVCDRHLLL